MIIKYQFSSFTIKELFGGCINYVYPKCEDLWILKR
jgi:hypothetical protein